MWCLRCRSEGTGQRRGQDGIEVHGYVLCGVGAGRNNGSARNILIWEHDKNSKLESTSGPSTF